MWWYLFDVILFQSCFLGLYLLFKKETFYAYNRLYLVATALLSFVIPLLDFGILAFSFGPEESTSQVARQFQSYFILGEEVNLSPSAGNVEPQTFSWSLGTWLKLIYLLGIGVFAIKFSIGYWKLKQLTQNARFDGMIDQVKCYRLSGSENAFTYWRSVFIGDQISEEQRQKIMAHEVEHAKAFHGLDLMIVELFRLIFWISPAHHWLKKELMLVHELQADQVAAQHLNKRDYAQSLLNQAFGTENLNFSHSFFNHSQLKQRLMMLQKKNSRPQHLFKYLLILPLLGLMLTYTSTKAQDQDNKQETTEKIEIEEIDNSIGNVPFSVVESVPLFPGCENLETNEERKACMSKKISEYVNNNFDTSLPKNLGLEGINRIYIQFKINKKGKVVNVSARAEKPELEVEAERVINGLPEMQPGKQKGQNVGVLYSLPITFQLGKNLDEKESRSPITKITEVKEDKVSYSGDVPFAVVEEVPVFPGCESLSSNEERRECMSEKISQFVGKNFNMKVAKENGLKGVNRVYVQFKIDKNGEITDLNARAATPELEAEGKRAVKNLPKMKPGQQKGKDVGVLYSLPIKFEIE